MSNLLLKYAGVEIKQQDLSVLENVNLDLSRGEFVYLIGKVGAGKSTLLKSIYAELPIYRGEAEVLEYSLNAIKRKNAKENNI